MYLNKNAHWRRKKGVHTSRSLGYVLCFRKSGSSSFVEKSTAPIHEFFPDANLNQIYFSGLEYAFVSKQGKQCHPFAYCKDFLHDAVWAEVNKKPVDIYSFKHVPGVNPPVDLQSCHIALRFKRNPDFTKQCKASLRFLNEIEKECDIPKTTMKPAGMFPGNNEATFVFYGNKQWITAAPLLSFYTYAIRAGLNYSGKGWLCHVEEGKLVGTKDAKYGSAVPALLDVLKGGNFDHPLKDNYPSTLDKYSMHNKMGMWSLAYKQVPKVLNILWGLKNLKNTAPYTGLS